LGNFANWQGCLIDFDMARAKEFEEADVLEKAVKLFSEKGYHGISMQELVDGLAINRSSIYDTFGDKHNLFLAALKYYRDTYTREMVERIEQSTDIRKTIAEVFEFVISDSQGKAGKQGCMMVNTAIELGPHEKDIASLIIMNFSAVEEAFAKAIQKAQHKKEINTRLSAKVMARFISNAINGLRVSAKAGADRKALEDVAKAAMMLLEK
jgi:TetR/AcrR family transcriptional repressor of nem operon